MARLSAILAAAAVAATTAAAVGPASAGPTLPAALSREEAALAESVRDSSLVVLAKTCGAACMEGVRARLAARCDVRVLPNIHMISARCGGGDAATSADGAAPPSVDDLLAGVPGVEASLPDSVVSSPASAAAADGAAAPTTARQARRDFWGLDRINQFALPLDGDASTAACYPSAGAGVTVYVVDSGCTAGHPQFEGRATSEAAPGSRFPSGADDNSHGSHVAGTVGGRDTGVAKRVTLRCVKVLNARGSGSSSDIAAAFDAVAGAKARDPAARIILSASLGGPAPRGGRSVTGTAARRAAEAGVVVVVAAGNDGGDACAVAPAQERALITVANGDRNDRLARSSNRGSCVDVIAPGTNILSVDGSSRTGGLKTFSGTSMAAPHVAGVAALILGDAPNGGRMTSDDVLARMTADAPRVGGYPMAFAGGACSGQPPAPGPGPGPGPSPPTVPVPPPAPEACTRVWGRVCRSGRRRRRRQQCRWVIVCAETGEPPAGARRRAAPRTRRARQWGATAV